MYKIHELQEMSDEQLKTVADGIGFKKNNISDRDKFIYDLLDFQACLLYTSDAADEYITV